MGAEVWYALPSLVGAAAVATLALVALPVASKGPSRRALTAMAASTVVFLVGDGMARLAAAGDLDGDAVAWFAMRGVGATFVPPSFLLFATTFAPLRGARWVRAATAVAFAVCAAIAVARAGTPLFAAEVRVVDHRLLVEPGELRTAFRGVFLVVQLSAVGLFLASARTATLARTRTEAAFAATASVLPIVGLAASIALSPGGLAPPVDPLSLALPAAFLPVFSMALRREVPAPSFAAIRSIFNSLPDPILVVNASSTVTFANDPARRLLASSVNPVEGARVTSALRAPAFGEEATGRLAGAVGEVVSGRASHVQLQVTTEPPHVLHYSVSILPAVGGAAEAHRDGATARRPQGPRPALVLFHDDTEIRAKEFQLSAANEAKDLFISMLSHDLRSPLNAISGFSELVALDAQSSADALAVYRYSQQIRDAAAQIQLMMDNARVFARMMDEGGGAPVREPQDIAAMVRRDVAGLARAAELKGMRIELTEQGPADQLVVAGSPILRNVFLNLLDNAIKYGSRGTVVMVGVRSYGEVVEVEVADEGPGIPADQRVNVFRKYTRLEQTRSGAEGIGIGLSIVQSIVTVHGGTVSIEDRPDGKSGAVFVVRLPRRAV